jgi:MFS transporter, AAHS family, 4-hydroxybenzoate transporter
MSVSSSIDITELIGRYPLGPLQIRIIVLCSLVALLEGFDILAIGAAAPAMAEPLHIAPNQIGFLFSAALFGLMLGAFGLGPIADRYGRRCVLIGATATFGVFTLCTAIAGTLQQVLLFRFFAGVGLGGAGQRVNGTKQPASISGVIGCDKRVLSTNEQDLSNS